MKVYCGNCRFYLTDPETPPYFFCLANYQIIDTATRRERIYANPDEKNKNNDCLDWSPNRRYRFRRWLKGYYVRIVDNIKNVWYTEYV